jgi:hypothetical protein
MNGKGEPTTSTHEVDPQTVSLVGTGNIIEGSLIGDHADGAWITQCDDRSPANCQKCKEGVSCPVSLSKKERI